MKFAVETNCWARFKAFLGRRTKREVAILSVELILVLLFLGTANFFMWAKPLIRDFAVANVAHVKAGPPIPFTEEEIAGYSRAASIDPELMYGWGMDSNSKWVADYSRKIIPYMFYEDVSRMGYTPEAAGVMPESDKDSFHVAGRMRIEYNHVYLNERYFIDGKWNDKRRALATLTHELVHAQGGAYLQGSSVQLESATSSATAEVLAGMCNFQDQLACKAFWHEIESLTRSNLIVNMDALGVRFLYEYWADAFWRTDIESISYLKAMRFWDKNPGQLLELRAKYDVIPWRNIRRGVLFSLPLDTGHIRCAEIRLACGKLVEGLEKCTVLGMEYDDTWFLMRGILWMLK